MESDPDASDSSSVEIEDQINISLLPERKRRRKDRFGGTSLTVQLKEMCGQKTAIYGGVTALLLLSVVLLAVFARPSSSYETVNTKSEKRDRYDFHSARNDEEEIRDQVPRKRSLRLPRNLSPIKYLVHLHPNLTTFKFTGKVDILMLCEEEAEAIVLHIGKNMTIKSVEVAVLSDPKNRHLKVEEITPMPDVEMISIKPNEVLEKGKKYFLMIKFESKLSTGLSGFYVSSYTSKAKGKRYLATTHFEPTDARRAFPCFDEPDMKAIFSIVITREKQHVALANMPLDPEKTPECGDEDDLCTDHFKPSVKMSTYLVAFVVCDYCSITKTTKNNVEVRVWAPCEQIDQGEFALDVAAKVLTYYEKIFAVKYPLPKQDLIAIPDFPTGAMENWGLITYRMTSILYNPTKSSDGNKQWVAVVVAHELAHQWFGNLVTMKWWNDLWLNEGFASFMENVGVNYVHPEWKMMDQFLLDKFQVAMGLDQLSNSHPIMARVDDPAQINSLFDSISYDKGAAIIRMLEEVIGEGNFFKGLQSYLQKYNFNNAVTNDLWECLNEQTNHDEDENAGDQVDVREMMETWTNQMGFPIITVERLERLDPRTVSASQKHFLIHPESKTAKRAISAEYSWVVPLTYITQSNSDKKVFIMNNGHEPVTFQLPHGTTQEDWIKMNAKQSGYYRVNYDTENWGKLTKQLNEDHTKLSAADRAGLLDDAMKLARNGMLDDEVALDLTTYLKKEKEYVPWMSALGNFAYIATQFSVHDDLTSSGDYPIYKRYMLGLLKNLTLELGWEEAESDPHLKRYLRSSLLKVVAEYDDDDETGVASTARKMFLQWLKGTTEITPNLRNTVYSIGMRDADRETWDEVFKKFQQETVSSEKRKLMYALTSSRNKDILQELLRYSLDKSKIRSQDSVAVINSIAHNPAGRILAWNYTQENYDKLYERYGKGSFDFSRLIKATTAHFNTEDAFNEVKTFFDEKVVGSGKLAVEQSLESIRANIDWIEKNRQSVHNWFVRALRRGMKPSPHERHMQRDYYDDDMWRRDGRP